MASADSGIMRHIRKAVATAAARKHRRGFIMAGITVAKNQFKRREVTGLKKIVSSTLLLCESVLME